MNMKNFSEMTIQEVAEYFDAMNTYSYVEYDEENELICLAPCGWSDNEEFLHNLLMFTTHHKEYVCTMSGGAEYFTTNQDNEYELRKVEK